MIDWKEWAQKNGMSHEEFKKELMLACASVMSLDLDGQDSMAAIKFTTSDSKSKIELYCRRVEK